MKDNNYIEQNILNHYKTFAIQTLGCKVNLYESEIIANQLKAIGLIEVDFKNKADIYIINTCSVTNSADAKSRNMINRAYYHNKNALVIVCGCYSQNYSEEIKNKLHIDILIGNKYKEHVLELINEYILNNKQKLVKVNNLMLEKQLEFTQLNDFRNTTRAFIKIQDGCNFMCSYCSIPFSRGKQRSVAFDEIIKNIKLLVENNYKEIVLTGVNTAGYQYEQYNFYDLLKAINDLQGEFRVRISSVEPFQINDEIVNLICHNKKRFCNHWHICLQSGDDEILKLMNRKYNIEQFYNLVSKIYAINSDCAISTDLIVGFPSESDQQFINSMEFVKKSKFSFLHVFPYSKRKYTKASLIKEQVNEKIKKERVKIALDLSKQLENNYLNQFVNKEVEVLWEKTENNVIFGKTSEYCEVISKNIDLYKPNQIDKVVVKKVLNNMLIID